MSWLDQELGPGSIAIDGVPQPQGLTTNFVAGENVEIVGTFDASSNTNTVTFIGTGGGGGGSTYDLDCSAGGTVVYAGPTSPFPATIFLTGAPAAAFDVEMPSGDGFQVVFVNQSGKAAAIFPSGGGGIAVIPATVTPVTVSSDGNTTAGPFPLATRAADVLPVNMSDFTGLGVQSIGAVNTNNAGQQSTAPIYGTVLNRLDAATYGITVPTIGSGPVAMQVGEAELELVDPGSGDNALTYGRLAISQSGVYVVSNPEIRYASARGTQRATKLEALYGATLTGPGATASYVFDLPIGITVLTLTCSARIVTAAGPDVAGDAYVTIGQFAWSNVGGTVTPLTITSGLPFEASQPTGTMAGTSFTPGTTGSQAQLIASTNGAINAGTTVDVQIWVEGKNE